MTGFLFCSTLKMRSQIVLFLLEVINYDSDVYRTAQMPPCECCFRKRRMFVSRSHKCDISGLIYHALFTPLPLKLPTIPLRNSTDSFQWLVIQCAWKGKGKGQVNMYDLKHVTVALDLYCSRGQNVRFAYVTNLPEKGKQTLILCKPNTLLTQEMRLQDRKHCRWEMFIMWTVYAYLLSLPHLWSSYLLFPTVLRRTDSPRLQ
jgi:hypothetical protein